MVSQKNRSAFPEITSNHFHMKRSHSLANSFVSAGASVYALGIFKYSAKCFQWGISQNFQLFVWSLAFLIVTQISRKIHTLSRREKWIKTKVEWIRKFLYKVRASQCHYYSKLLPYFTTFPLTTKNEIDYYCRARDHNRSGDDRTKWLDKSGFF